MSTPVTIFPTISALSLVLSASLAGLAFSHTTERFARYSFSKYSLLDSITILLFLASFTWYGKRVRDYWIATSTHSVIFYESDAILQIQHVLPTLAMVYAQTIFAGTFSRTAGLTENKRLWNYSSSLLAIIAFVLMIIPLAMPSLSLVGWKWTTASFSLILLLGNLVSAVIAYQFGIKLKENIVALCGLANAKSKEICWAVLRFRNASAFGVAYHILSLMTIAATQAKDTGIDQELFFVDSNSFQYANLIVRDMYVWVIGWSCFRILQLKFNDPRQQISQTDFAQKSVSYQLPMYTLRLKHHRPLTD